MEVDEGKIYDPELRVDDRWIQALESCNQANSGTTTITTILIGC